MNVQLITKWLPNYLIPFFTFSYPTSPPTVLDAFPESRYYNTGVLDICIIITCIAVMAVLRDFARLFILEPFARWKLTMDLRRKKMRQITISKANGTPKRDEKQNGMVTRKANGIANGNGHAAHANGNGHAKYYDNLSATPQEARKMHRSVLRFAEQGWSVISYTFTWCLGLYIHNNLPTRILDPIDAWLNYPHIPLAAPVKFYYLLETALYCHQILIIHAEARRKDHWQMLTHHVITIFLMVGSYFCNYTRVGCLIMFLMDWCDILLPLAKMFRYLSLSKLCDATFVSFLISWAVTRHALFIIAIKSTWSALDFIPLVWDSERGYYKSKQIHLAFFSMLVMLQVLQIMWFWMIGRVAWRVVSGKGAEDNRSDDEDDDSSDDGSKKDE